MFQSHWSSYLKTWSSKKNYKCVYKLLSITCVKNESHGKPNDNGKADDNDYDKAGNKSNDQASRGTCFKDNNDIDKETADDKTYL